MITKSNNKQYLTQSELLRRDGWTSSKIKKLLGEPDLKEANSCYQNGRKMHLYDLERIKKAEAGAVDSSLPAEICNWDTHYPEEDGLTSEELKELVAVLSAFEEKSRRIYALNYVNGGYALTLLESFDKDNIVIMRIYGVASDCRDSTTWSLHDLKRPVLLESISTEEKVEKIRNIRILANRSQEIPPPEEDETSEPVDETVCITTLMETHSSDDGSEGELF